MSSAKKSSVEELREESERTREALASTVGALRDKFGDTATELKTLLSPTHIKRELKTFAREERADFVNSVQRKAKENPLQLAALGAAAAYPVWGLLRAIPTPLLLIGAGLFLTSERGQQSAKEMKGKVDDVVQRGSARVSDMAGSIRSDIDDRIAGERYRAEEIIDTVSSAVGSVVETAQAKFHDTTDAVKAAVGGGLPGAATATAEGFSGEPPEVEEVVKDGSAGGETTSRKAVTTFMNDNPLLVAGIAAAVGAFIAASIPASEAENRLFGTGSEKLKNKVRNAASQGIEKVGDIAVEAAGSVAAAAAREGLDATGVHHAINTVADSVRKVADRGIDTALGTTPKPIQQPSIERNPT